MAAILGILMLMGAVSMLTACKTTAGAGEDASAAGHAVTDSAERNR
ncbi:MAG TPA: entericidin [Alphaproteobacteria bacterium]|nr:entericidin [Alphaproteobacteria bacterium]